MIKVSILTIGDEICIGQIINTNASWIAQRCIELGCSVVTHSTVGDEKIAIISELGRLLNLSDIVLVTGGLGPTSDDLTKPALLEYFEDELVFREEVFEWIKDFFAQRGITEISERNKNLAYLPSKCKPLRNRLGTAPGMLFFEEGKILASMPGVPDEMKYLMNEYVIPLIKDKIQIEHPELVVYKTIQTCGIPESVLADKLLGIEDIYSDVSIAYLPSNMGVRIRLGAFGFSSIEAESKIQPVMDFIYSKVSEYILGVGEVSLSEAVGNLLKEQNKTVAVAESCTGGMLGSIFTDTPGSSEYFMGGVIAYSNNAKIKILGVDPETIEKYGAVSKETATQMARGVRKLFSTDFGISITGIAGPTGGTTEKPVGTVWIALADIQSVDAEKFQFGNVRKINRERSVAAALTKLYLKLKNLNQ